jgi:hypothetical protein
MERAKAQLGIYVAAFHQRMRSMNVKKVIPLPAVLVVESGWYLLLAVDKGSEIVS